MVLSYHFGDIWKMTWFLDYGNLVQVQELPGKPVDCNERLRSINYALLWSIVTNYFGLLDCPC